MTTTPTRERVPSAPAAPRAPRDPAEAGAVTPEPKLNGNAGPPAATLTQAAPAADGNVAAATRATEPAAARVEPPPASPAPASAPASPSAPGAPPAAAPAQPTGGPAAPSHGSSPGGHMAPPPAKANPARLLLLIPIVLIVSAVTVWAGTRYWYENAYFVGTENAFVGGDLVQFGSLNAGRIIAVRAEVGDWVDQDQEVAVITVPRQTGVVANEGTSIFQAVDSNDLRVPVRAPISGIIASRASSVGGTVAVGQTMFTVVNPRRTWVTANIEEAKVARIKVGHRANVHVDALGQDFAGRVIAITPASAATFSLLPQSNASGNFTKVTQYVPIRIAVDNENVVLPLGTSVVVKVQVQEPENLLPWLGS